MADKPSCSNASRKSMKKEAHNSSEEEPARSPKKPSRSARFDESNIRETYHPQDKTYGFDTINEPKTPYERNAPPVDPEELKRRLLKLVADEDDEDEDQSERASTSSKSISVAASESKSRFEPGTFSQDKHIQSEYSTAKKTLTNDVGDDQK